MRITPSALAEFFRARPAPVAAPSPAPSVWRCRYCDPPVDSHGRGALFVCAGCDRAREAATPAVPGPPPVPEVVVPMGGCCHCDLPKDGHGIRYTTLAGRHEWVEPVGAQVEQRRTAHTIHRMRQGE